MQVAALLALLVQRVRWILVLLAVLQGAVGHGVGHDAELAEEDLPEEQVDPRVQDLVEGGQADRRQEEVAVQADVPAGGVRGYPHFGVAIVGGDLGGDHPQHQHLGGERERQAPVCTK